MKHYFKYEQQRDNATPYELANIAGELWDAGAYLILVRDKVPLGKWKESRNTREEVVAWVEQGNHVAIAHPANELGISCVDIDHGLHYIDKAIKAVGAFPLCVHESSRTREDKCHVWFSSNPSQTYKWEGGDVRSGSMHYVVLYNLYAVRSAYRNAMSNQQVSLGDIGALPGIKGTFKADLIDIPADDTGHRLDDDVARSDGEVVNTNRHNVMIAKIARAVEQCTTRSELNHRLRIIINAHKEAILAGKDQARIDSLKMEISNARVFAEGGWAKRKARKQHERVISGFIKGAHSKEEVRHFVDGVVDEYHQQCLDMGWPTPDKCQHELTSYFDHVWEKKQSHKDDRKEVIAKRNQIIDASNQSALASFESNGVGEFMVKSEWGTIASWQEAADVLGVKFRFNTFIEQGEVWIPETIIGAKEGGRWIDIDENNFALIVSAIEKHCKALTGPKDDVGKGVYLGRNKQREARNDLFGLNSFCPMRNYFMTLPEWCGTPLIHKSMERGGMVIDAGEFTGAVQSFMWLFTVRNCLFPGSSVREYVVLHGPHACGKSKFVELALPSQLKTYYNGGFSMDGSLKQKLERSKGKALMECGEFGEGGRKDWAAIKQWLTLSDVNGERMAYAEFVKRHKLTATTIFTTNKQELPPTDDAVLSRFIWASVKSPAHRYVDPSTGSTKELVWSHFDELYDPERPELGTWREQYFAEALHIVKQSVKRRDWVEDGVKMTSYTCNPEWLPEGAITRLVDHNKKMGSTYSTDQSMLVDDIVDAIDLLDDEYGTDTKSGDVWWPNMEIKTAIHFWREGGSFEGWFTINNRMANMNSERTIDAIRRTANDKQFANAITIAAERMGLIAVPKRGKYPKSPTNSVMRGYNFISQPNSQEPTPS